MSIFKKAFNNPVTGALAGAVLGPVGMVAGGLLGKKNQDNKAIDSQIVEPGSAPAMMSTSLPGGTSGLSPYGQLMRQGNAADAMLADEEAQGAVLGDAAQARSQIANAGGLNSGAAERVSRSMMGNAAAARQGNAYGLMRTNLASDASDTGNQMDWAQKATVANQNMQGQIYGGNTMANATLNANRPKGLLGVGFLGL